MAEAVRVQQRTILLCDLDAFFAAVEILDRPELAGRPVVVGGDPRSRGVVATCNYEARRYGIRSAMPLAEAYRRCPHAIFLPTRHRRYRQVSQQVLGIYRRYTEVIEPVSIDEAYLDLRGRPGMPVAAAIKAAVARETGLVVSIGIGPNKFLAKLACELSKPNGLREIPPEKVEQFLAPLPVQLLPGVGPKTAQHLRELGIEIIGQLQARSLQWCIKAFGKRGEALYNLARGQDYRPVEPSGEIKSISDETTFDHDRPASSLLPDLYASCRTVGRRLRAAGRRAYTVTIKVRYPNFVTITRSRTLQFGFDADEVIYQTAYNLFRQHVLQAAQPAGPQRRYGRRGPFIRLLGVQVSNFEPVDAPYQTSLFDQVVV